MLHYLGRLHPKKGLLKLVGARASVPFSTHKEWLPVIAGWHQAGHETEVKCLARGLGVEMSVRFVGPQYGDDKEATLVRADAFVLPSFSEGLPVAVFEAWPWALPVLMTPQCNLPEGFAARPAVR